MTHRHRPATRRGFTLVELLVVVSIVILVSAVTLPTILPALNNRQAGEAARLVQAVLAGARDSAIRANAPRGLRLIPDPSLPNTSSRMIMIEPAPDLSDGLATFVVPTLGKYNLNTSNPTPYWSNANGNPPGYPFPDPLQRVGTLSTLWGPYPPGPYKAFYPHYLSYSTTPKPFKAVLIVEQAVLSAPPGGTAVPNASTNWFWNVRIGDKFRFNDSGQYYTVVGPMTQPNPDFFVNDGPPGKTPSLVDTFFDNTGPPTAATATTVYPEFLFLVNGVDDDGNGYTDEGFDGIDNEGGFYTGNNPASPTPDDITEWGSPLIAGSGEQEQWVGAQAVQYANAVSSNAVPPGKPYVITRRPVPVPGSREVALPGGVVIDMTTMGPGGSNERSRLPIDLLGNVDVLLNQAGQVVPTTLYSTPASSSMGASFYHFWIADRGDVHDPIIPANTGPPYLPMPAGTVNTAGTATYPPAGNPNLGSIPLKKERQLVTLFTRTGNVVTGSIENFLLDDINAPYYDAQRGVREAK